MAEDTTPQPDNPMPCRVCHIAEILLGGLFAIITAASRLLIATAETPTEQRQEMSWLLLPMIGAGFAALVAFLLNPAIEDRKSVGGRIVGGLFFGAVSPQLLFYFSETIQKASIIPAVPLTLGFLICSLVFMLIKPIFREGFFRSKKLSYKVWDNLQDKAGLGENADESGKD